MSEELFGTSMMAEDTRRLFEFSKINSAMFERFRLFCKNNYGIDFDDVTIEELLTEIFARFDKVSGNIHAKALDAFHEKQTPENMALYFEACDSAIAYAYKTQMIKKIGLTFESLEIWDALNPEKPKTFRLSLSDLEKL